MGRDQILVRGDLSKFWMVGGEAPPVPPTRGNPALADELIEKTSSKLDETASKPCIKTKNVIDRGKRSKTLNEVKPVAKICKNPHSFLEISPVQKEVLPSHKLQDHA